MRFDVEHRDRRKRGRRGTPAADGGGATRRFSGYCLIGQAADGTRRRLLSGIVTRRLAARVRQLMTESVAYADLRGISIEREQSAPDGSHVTPEWRASDAHFLRERLVRGVQPV